MRNEDIAILIQQEAKATRLLLKSFYQDSHAMTADYHKLLEKIHEDNLESQERFRQTLERWGKPGDN